MNTMKMNPTHQKFIHGKSLIVTMIASDTPS